MDKSPLLEQATNRLDQIIATLNAPAKLDRWRYWHGPTEALSEEEALQGDASQWEERTVRIPYSTASGQTWLRHTLSYPAEVEGISTVGAKLELLTSLLVKSRVFVNGRVAAQHDWWLDGRIAPIPLAAAYDPKQPIEIACHVPQGDGLGGYGGGSVRCSAVATTIDQLDLLRSQLVFSHFLVADDAQRLAAWEQAVDRLPWAALNDRDWHGWWQGVEPVIDQLAKLTPKAKDYVVHAAAHSHIDMNWLWPWEDTVDVIQRDFRTVDQLMDRYPDFRFSQSQASTYWAMEQQDPALLERVKARVAEGKWELTANTWVENDLNMSATEAMAHHFLYTRRYMRELTGQAPDLVWEPDTFGHPATMPQIVRKGGAKYYYFCRGGKRYPLFWWESADGSRILGFQDLHWYLGALTSQLIADSAIELAALHGLTHSLVVYGVGDHGGGATITDIEMAKTINQAPCLPTVKFDHAGAFFREVERANPALPVVEEELNPVFAGCYTSHADVKLLNRRGELALIEAEALATAASLLERMDYPQVALEKNWRTVLFQQFHDILCGCGIGITSDVAHEWAAPAIAEAQATGQQALTAILGEAGDGQALAVFNTLPWSRSEIVEAHVDWDCQWVKDDSGNRLPAQRAGETLLFVAQDVPGLGYRRYTPGDDTPLDDEHAVIAPAALTLENKYLLIQVDERSGAIRRCIDKQAGRDLTHHALGDPGAELASHGVLNRLQILWEQPHGMSAWKIGDISRVDHLVNGAQVTCTETGPVRGTIEVRHQFLRSSLVQRIHLYAGSHRVDFDTVVDWHERGSDRADAPMLRVTFGPELGYTRATYQVPFGTVSRPADGQEVPAQMWADLSEIEGKKPYGMALLNDSKYGYQAHGNTLGLTLVRASYEPDQNPDEGLHRFRYSFYPHPGDWLAAQVEQQAQGFNRPCWLQLVGDDAAWPANQPLLHCDTPGVSLTGIKRSEDGQALVVRLLNLTDQPTLAAVHWFRPVAAAHEVQLDETPLLNARDDLRADGTTLYVPLQPTECRTIWIEL